ncbi:hypothetical protein INT47_010233 [Mucor saturninus]|uniref:Uncharacterized protein n=1 Tax=Mucor saturninus TaxID=64648 RepID=A0A8H7V7M3_9FUNG|nr:hypothetical protein INT47_010233 [Mucor saturninus]
MPRTPIYPEVEKFIILKKRAKLEKVKSDSAKESSTTQTPKRTSTKRKDSPNVIVAKKSTKRSRQASTSAAAFSSSKCSSCQEEGHNSARSRQCKNYNLNISELLQIKLGPNYQRYTLSVPFDTFCFNTQNKTSSLKKIKDISSFIREVLFKAQLFVNFFILQHPTKLTNDFFEQNFWYTISRVIRGSSNEVRSILQAYKDKKKERPAGQNLDVAQLISSFAELSATMNGNLFVPENGLKNYGQSLSTACETVATTYNNYYIENFENIICNYFIYALKTKYANAKVGSIKKLVYNHVYDQVFTHPQLSSIPVDILAFFDPDVGNNLTSFLDPLILEVKNRISTLPLSKESLNNEPFKILPVLRYILKKYDDIYNAQATQNEKIDSMKSPLPRRFSLFPNPSLHWRFIKIDSQNLSGIFPDAKQNKQPNESSFDHQQRCFYQMFDFKRLGIQNYENLQALPEQKERMFLNGLYTDGYTCRVLFARKVLPSPPEEKIRLELDDLSSEEVNKHFRPCTVDPGRQDPFVSYHGGSDIRRLSSSEYYNMGGNVTRMKEQQKHKHRLGIEKIETDIPSPKTASAEQFVSYITYMSQHMNTLFDFYDFETAQVKWLNYLSSQKAIQESVNILINGGKKYNKDKRKKTRKNRKRRKKNRKPRTNPVERTLITAPKSKSYSKKNKACFEISISLRHRRLICNCCLQPNLENLKVSQDDHTKKIHQVLKCITCNIYWNRDVMASKNMFTIAHSIWNGNDRPTVFKRQTATSNVVASAHSSESTA